MQKLFPHCHLPTRSLALWSIAVSLSLNCSNLHRQFNIHTCVSFAAAAAAAAKQKQLADYKTESFFNWNQLVLPCSVYICIQTYIPCIYTYTETNPTLCWLDTVHSLIHSEGCHNCCCCCCPRCCLVNWCVFDCKFVTNISLECTASHSLPSLPPASLPPILRHVCAHAALALLIRRVGRRKQLKFYLQPNM